MLHIIMACVLKIMLQMELWNYPCLLRGAVSILDHNLTTLIVTPAAYSVSLTLTTKVFDRLPNGI